ncbi:MAG: hypothetical protein MI754_17520, partial [Chromatiales bacterium]|nr:hypothetical protein [Chromatiales bacterium]
MQTDWFKRVFVGPGPLILLSAAVVGVALAVTLVHLAERQLLWELDRLGNERLDLYASTVQAAHKRFDYLPFIVSGDYQVKGLLRGENYRSQVNRKLQSWQQEANAAELYLMDRQGVVLASSNWRQPDSFVGNDYHFRPYFRDALAGGQGRFFAVGVTTGRPGLFLSRPVRDGDQVIGVAVVKIDMTQLEADWAAGGEDVWVTDADGVIFLASNPQWRYTSLEPLPRDTLARLDAERKYSTNPITALMIAARSTSPQGKQIIQLAVDDAAPTQRYMLHSRSVVGLDWTLYYLTSLADLADQQRNAVLIASLTAIMVALL